MKEREVVLQILGMSCPSCSEGIQTGLARLEGVVDAKVNFASKEAIVKFDEDKISLDKIKAAIKRGGYEAAEQV
jgi:copper chaperone CopZ